MGQGYQGALSVLICAASDCVAWHTQSLLSYSLLTGNWAAQGVGGLLGIILPNPAHRPAPQGTLRLVLVCPAGMLLEFAASHQSSGEENVFRMLAEGKRELAT